MKRQRSDAAQPRVSARIAGSEAYPAIRGLVTFSPMGQGTWVQAEVTGLPPWSPATATTRPVGPFGFHLHEGSSCAPSAGAAPFADAGGHYNPDNQPHGNHAGDFPVLFSSGGTARMAFYTDRFTPRQAVGHTVMIHLNPDDYVTQPAGNSGPRIACGPVVEG